MGYTLPSTSVPSMPSSRSRRRPSGLRNEIPRSPDDNKVYDLFKYTRTRLSDIPYKHPMRADNSRLTNDDLRKQMLSTIFGWHNSVKDLVRDERNRHPTGSASRILLAKWLGDMDSDIMAGSSQNMSSSDWMMLALSGIGGQESQHKLGRSYVQRLLEGGDVHVAVTIMLGMGDHNDAIEVYVSHKRYMEALILTCLTYPGVWERQAAIIRKWGEWAVQHQQQQLAIRCFACTDQESTEPWSSPSAVQLNFQSITPSIPEILSPPLSPPGIQRGPQRSIAKNSALKLITSFGDQQQKSKFYSLGDGGQTPIAAGVTPIAESAISPGGFDTTTAFIRPSSNSRFNTPTSARAAGSSLGRGRLPSIGEVPADLNREALRAEAAAGKRHKERSIGPGSRMSSAEQDNLAAGISLQRASTASPMMMRDGYQRVVGVGGPSGERPPSPNQDILAKMEEARSSCRNGSRDRIPRGVSLQVNTIEPATADVTSPEQSVGSSSRYHWPSRRRGTGSVTSSVTSTSSAGRGTRTNTRHLEDYIHSLDAAQHYKNKGSRNGSKEREKTRDSSRGRHDSRERRTKSREASEERGRTSARSFTKPKRSPTSPIPMSPEDLANLSTPRYFERSEPSTTRRTSASHGNPKTGSRTSSRGSQRSRGKSPDGRVRPAALDIRGRSKSKGREGSQQRSPSSPLPLSATATTAVLHYQGSEDEEDFKRAMQEQEVFRARHSRNSSRGLNSPIVSKREASETRRREAAEARDTVPSLMLQGRAASTEHAGDLRQMKDERQRKKEQAAQELEERRKSLAKRPQAPPIPHPSDITSPLVRVGVEMAASKDDDQLPPRCATEPPKSMYARAGPHIGLPATPKAMKLVVEAENNTKRPSDPKDVSVLPFSPQPETLTSATYSAEAKDGGVGPLTLLPSTVYQPPVRPAIPRSMSAPIPDEPALSQRYMRKVSVGEARGIDEVVSVNGTRRRSQEDISPAPPPMLKELAHLAIPPPPPPAPLPYARRSRSGGALGSGMIEIVMDDDDSNAPVAVAPNDGMVPVLAPPAPPSRGHNRGRSFGEGEGISGRLSRASDRLRSASRSRKDARASIKSPRPEVPVDTSHRPVSTLKSPVAGAPPPVLYDQDAIRSPIEPNRKHLSTGLHRSEMF